MNSSAAFSSRLRCRYGDGEVWRSRGVSAVVLTGTVDLPPLPARLLADWRRETRETLDMAPGDVEVLPLARARSRWPDFRLCVARGRDWLVAQGLDGGLLDDADMALMACRGARYHHDGERYGGSAFFNLFVGGDPGLDLHFAASGQRIPLVGGTAVVFDTCQPHAVIPRESAGFDPADFGDGRNWEQFFLTWELPVEDAALAGALGIAFDEGRVVETGAQGALTMDGAACGVCPASGRWLPG